MKHIVSTVCQGTVGGTFVDWSIHFLAGKQDYFSGSKKQLIPLINNPVSGINAHGHLKNHPWGVQATEDFFNTVVADSTTNLYSCYPIRLPYQIVAKRLNLNIHNLSEKEIYSKILKFSVDETTELTKLCFQQSTHVVHLDDRYQSLELLSFFSRQLEYRYTDLSKPNNEQELFDEQDQLWNRRSADHWNNTGLSEIWDKRERLALDIRPIGKIGVDFVVDAFVESDLTKEHLRIGVRDLWCRGEQLFVELMDYINLPVDPATWVSWQLIYKQWATNQSSLLAFVDNLPYILEAIVNNWYYCLPVLSFKQEVLIQHFLIYKYNLNLKTWQLDKFPNNTQALHALLESNTHNTQLLY
jgi:hypothetical protein